MAVTLVPGQTLVSVTNHWVASATASAKSLPSAAAAGNLIVVVVRIGDGTGSSTVSSIDDAGSTTFSLARRQQDFTIGNTVEIWWGIAAGANAGTGVVVTKNNASDSTDDIIALLAFAGNDATQASLSTNGSNTASTQSHDSGSVAPGTANNVIVAICSGTGGDWSNDPDFTNLLDNNRSLLSYRIQATDTAQTFTATSDANEFTTMAIVAFKGAASGSSLLSKMRRYL